MTDSDDELFLQIQVGNVHSEHGNKENDEDINNTASECEFLPIQTENLCPNYVNVDLTSTSSKDKLLCLHNQKENNNPKPLLNSEIAENQALQFFKDDTLLFEDDFDESGDANVLEALKKTEGILSSCPFKSQILSFQTSLTQKEKENFQQQQTLDYNQSLHPTVITKKITSTSPPPLLTPTPATAFSFDKRDSDDELFALLDITVLKQTSSHLISTPLSKFQQKSLVNEANNDVVQKSQDIHSHLIGMPALTHTSQKQLFKTGITTIPRPASPVFNTHSFPCSDDESFRSVAVINPPGTSRNVITPSPRIEEFPSPFTNKVFFSSSPISSRNINMDTSLLSEATKPPVGVINLRKTRRRIQNNPFLDLEAEVSNDENSSTDDSNDDEKLEGLDKYESSFVDNENDEEVTTSQQIRYIRSVKDIIPVDFGIPQQPTHFVGDTINVTPVENDASNDSDSLSIVNNDIEFADIGVFTQAMNEAEELVRMENQNSAKRVRTRRQTRARESNSNPPGTPVSKPKNKRRRRRIICADSSSDD